MDDIEVTEEFLFVKDSVSTTVINLGALIAFRATAQGATAFLANNKTMDFKSDHRYELENACKKRKLKRSYRSASGSSSSSSSHRSGSSSHSDSKRQKTSHSSDPKKPKDVNDLD